jgi:hypothetical protein
VLRLERLAHCEALQTLRYPLHRSQKRTEWLAAVDAPVGEHSAVIDAMHPSVDRLERLTAGCANRIITNTARSTISIEYPVVADASASRHGPGDIDAGNITEADAYDAETSDEDDTEGPRRRQGGVACAETTPSPGCGGTKAPRG